MFLEDNQFQRGLERVKGESPSAKINGMSPTTVIPRYRMDVAGAGFYRHSQEPFKAEDDDSHVAVVSIELISNTLTVGFDS